MNIETLHNNYIAQRHMEIIEKCFNRIIETDLMAIIRIAIMEITDRNLTLSINSVHARIGNGKDRQNGVNRCEDNAKNKFMSPILNIILESLMSLN